MMPLDRKLPKRPLPPRGGGRGSVQSPLVSDGEWGGTATNEGVAASCLPGESDFPPTQPPPQRGEVSFGSLGSGGFSLIELLMVLLLVGIMAGVAGPPIGRFLDSLEFKKQTAKIMATVRYARLKAITEGQFVVMTATERDAAQGLTLSGAVNEVRPLDLAEGATLEIDPLELVFSPEGYATPGTLVLTSGARSETILIDPLTGLPLLEDADEK